ncbi:MAG: FAD-binding protein [Spirochaetes bacterium]|nr:FAD-binding protein [Spirochaetota bacterium]
MSGEFLGKKVFFEDAVFDCLIVGTGAAAFNAALHLYGKGLTNIALVTNSLYAGTSRNTGSDKQTYYKIACAGDQADSPRGMAQTLFGGASMDGDIALCEASHSLQEFFHLVSIGVDFPHNRYGEFAGYKTDHDPLQRASSIGPYTSKEMTEKLEAETRRRNISIIDKSRVVKLLLDEKSGRAYGLCVLEKGECFRVYFAKNIIFATGGNPGMYRNTVYPPSQFGASGIMAREGVRFANMTEWQYGIASVKFRWNLSGSYQQIIPRYVSVDKNGNEEEFLSKYFSSPQNAQKAVFLKGYQWPFDPGKISGEGSSLVDMAIYIEKHVEGKRVFLDYTRNPQGLAWDKLDATAYEYLAKSDALDALPIDRLKSLNPLAYELYLTNKIDLAKEPLEIDVVPQHHNGGAEIDIWWGTSAGHLFAVGECAGTHGVHRPGGSALNSGQVGGCRAAARIAATVKADAFFTAGQARAKAEAALELFAGECAVAEKGRDVSAALAELQEMNSRCASFIRPVDAISENMKLVENAAEVFAMPEDLADFFALKEIQIMSRLMYAALDAYIKGGGKSRGSYLIVDSLKNIKDYLKGAEIDSLFRDKVLTARYTPEARQVESSFRPVRPIPESDTWFEQIWHEYRSGKLYGENF